MPTDRQRAPEERLARSSFDAKIEAVGVDRWAVVIDGKPSLVVRFDLEDLGSAVMPAVAATTPYAKHPPGPTVAKRIDRCGKQKKVWCRRVPPPQDSPRV